MGELFICNEPIAAMPYYIEGISWNIYSLEELCYYIEHNIYLLEKNFMTEELCTWIKEEVKNEALAEQLHEIIEKEGSLTDFVGVLLAETGYCPREIAREIIVTLGEMEEKSDFECSKIRADRLMEHEKYLSSIYEYKGLLESDEAGEQSKELIGSIWHNQGTAYARLFLFAEAIRCYEKAYKYNHNVESLKQCMKACYCHYDELGFEIAMEAYQPDPQLVEEVKKEMEQAYHSKEVETFGDKFGSIVALKALGRRADFKKEVGDLIFQWKEEYRRICRI